MSVTHTTENEPSPGVGAAYDRAHYPVYTPVEILQERQKTYGPNTDINLRAFGFMLRGILEIHFQQPLPGDIPPHIGGLIMTGIKALRAATPFEYNDDNYKDGHNYLDLAKSCDPRNKPTT
jgi:hypothetical protein